MCEHCSFIGRTHYEEGVLKGSLREGRSPHAWGDVCEADRGARRFCVSSQSETEGVSATMAYVFLLDKILCTRVLLPSFSCENATSLAEGGYGYITPNR